MVFGNGVKNMQAAAYNVARTVYIIHVVSHFYGTEFEIWAGFGPVGSTENCST